MNAKESPDEADGSLKCEFLCLLRGGEVVGDFGRGDGGEVLGF